MVAHYTVNGCNLQPGDLLNTSTLSGPTPDQAGALIELTVGGKQPLTLRVRKGRRCAHWVWRLHRMCAVRA